MEPITTTQLIRGLLDLAEGRIVTEGVKQDILRDARRHVADVQNRDILHTLNS